MAQSLSGRRSSTTLLPLTAAQIHLVRTIWRQVYITKGPTVIGSTLLHRIFFKSVKTKNQFSRCPFPHRFPNRDSFNKAHAKATGELLDKVKLVLFRVVAVSGTANIMLRRAVLTNFEGAPLSKTAYYSRNLLFPIHFFKPSHKT